MTRELEESKVEFLLFHPTSDFLTQCPFHCASFIYPL